MAQISYRISGHETFIFRYSWPPKVVVNAENDPYIFKNDDQAMTKLGVGKNMVQSMKFWSQAAGIVKSNNNFSEISELGKKIFGSHGIDKYLEDVKTLWLLHWNLSTNKESPLLAWHFLLNCWHYQDFTKNETVSFLIKELNKNNLKFSEKTVESHASTFIHTYIQANNKNDYEDTLDCPLAELSLIIKLGERKNDSSIYEPIYAFRVEEKPEISQQLFVYCINDYWNKYYPNEKTLLLHNISVGKCSPGQVFKLPENAIRERLDVIEQESNGLFVYKESSALQQIIRKKSCKSESLIEGIYRA